MLALLAGYGALPSVGIATPPLGIEFLVPPIIEFLAPPIVAFGCHSTAPLTPGTVVTPVEFAPDEPVEFCGRLKPLELPIAFVEGVVEIDPSGLGRRPVLSGELCPSSGGAMSTVDSGDVGLGLENCVN